MPKGIYFRSPEWRENARIRLVAYNKSLKHIESCKKGGIRNIPRLVVFNKSENHRNSVAQMNKTFNYGGKFLSKYNKSEKHKEDIRHSDKHRRSSSKRMKDWINSEVGIVHAREIGKKYGMRSHQRITKQQRILNKELLENGIETVMEKKISKCRRFIDIAIPKVKLAIEVDGASHYNENLLLSWGKSLVEKENDDKLKDKELKSLGWTTVRIDDREIKNNLNAVVERIKNEFASRNLHPDPRPIS